MKKKLVKYLLICACVIALCGCKKEKEETMQPVHLVINNESVEVEKTDEEVPETEMEKVETGIKNWANATLGLDSSFSAESTEIMNEKLYEAIQSDEQREQLKKERDEFYKDSQITTESVDVDIKKANKAIYGEKAIGYVECTVTIAGTRNDKSFEDEYELVLLLDYMENITSVYKIVDITF